MPDHHNQPLGHERVHAKHPSLHGAVCRVHSVDGPWVTCMLCLKRLNLPRIAEPVRVHARCTRYGAFKRSLCGEVAHG
jgi:hypothetical protein